jgi:antitoxin ParD1/3/4
MAYSNPDPEDAAMTLNINLTPQLEKMVRRKVASGSYNSASEVVREALRLMEEQDDLRRIKLQRLRQDIEDGLNSGPSTPWDPEEFLAEVHAEWDKIKKKESKNRGKK